MSVLNNEIPRARMLADLDKIDELPELVAMGLQKIVEDECDIEGCTKELYACIQDHFFCEECSEGFVATISEHLLDQAAYRITR